jgi:hypothetical protein
LVHTEDGLKPIEDIQIGEKVLSMNENTGKTSYQPVTDLIQGERQYRLIEITLDSGKSIEATADHPFYIKGKGWNPASSLSVGQVLELHDGTIVVVKEVDTSIRRDFVYNLTVANTHNYFVGEDGVLVHNAKKSKKPKDNFRLSDENMLPKPIREEYEKIKLGQGTPRVDRYGNQKRFGAGEIKNVEGMGDKNRWDGAKEWDVPGTTHRILELPDGKLGYAKNHDYKSTCLFPGPWYPEGGKPSWKK